MLDPKFNAEAAIAAQCDQIKALLIEKNRAYGNSALDPVRIFSRVDAAEQIRVRIDDKLSRLQRGSTYGNEDTVLDLIGYLVLLRIAGSQPEQAPLVQERTVVDFRAGSGVIPSTGVTIAVDRGLRDADETVYTFIRDGRVRASLCSTTHGKKLDAVGEWLDLARCDFAPAGGGPEPDTSYRERLLDLALLRTTQTAAEKTS